MISDVLGDAAEGIRDYRRKYPDAYHDIAPLLDDLLEKMETVRSLLDTPPPALAADTINDPEKPREHLRPH
jgi:hypothetical protein